MDNVCGTDTCYIHKSLYLQRVIIRLEAQLQPNIGFTFEPALKVFTRSDITLPKVNRF